MCYQACLSASKKQGVVAKALWASRSWRCPHLCVLELGFQRREVLRKLAGLAVRLVKETGHTVQFNLGREKRGGDCGCSELFLQSWTTLELNHGVLAEEPG